MELEVLKYPIGQVEIPEDISQAMIDEAINRLEQLPSRYSKSLEHLDENQLNSPYRPNGWTIRQVVHHVAESHMNGFIRFKWALTEDTPSIKAYHEQLWADHTDVKDAPVAIGLHLIAALHAKWVYLMKGMTDAEWARKYFHPEADRTFMLKESLIVYDWHGKHHLAHITSLRERMGW
ncbi:MAG: putative metal-dependent hydrolase [Cyclobacteriaceae bacterium]